MSWADLSRVELAIGTYDYNEHGGTLFCWIILQVCYPRVNHSCLVKPHIHSIVLLAVQQVPTMFYVM